MCRKFALILTLALSFCFGSVPARSEQPATENGRKVVRKVEPRYPDIARRMNLSGTVRVVAVVAPDGSVIKVEPMGGSPILMEAAETAVSRWKYAPGSESRETVELRFHP